MILNNAATAQTISFKTNLSMWLPPSSNYQVTSYDSSGKAYASGGPCQLAMLSGTSWQGSTSQLAPLDMAFCEVTAE